MKVIASNVKINISDEEVTVDIKVNEQGNLVIDGVGSLSGYEMVNDELILMR